MLLQKEGGIIMEFTNNDPHRAGFICQCGSGIMTSINEDHPHGMSALNDEYDYVCFECNRLLKSTDHVMEEQEEYE